MRRKIIVLSFLIVCYASSAHAADEFGARFTGRAPVALGESVDTSKMEIAGPMLPKNLPADINPSAIEPAAGDETQTEKPDQNPGNNAPQATTETTTKPAP